MLGKKLQEVPVGQRPFPEGFDSLLKSFLDYVETDLELYFTIPDLLAAKLKFTGPELS